MGLLAAFVPPFDATLCSGFAPRGRCCCDAGFHWRLGPLRVKPLLSVFVDAPVSCDAGRCGEGEQQLQLEQQLQQRNKKFLEGVRRHPTKDRLISWSSTCSVIVICSRVFLSGFGRLMMRSKISRYKLRKKSLIVVMVTMLQFGLLLQRRLTLNLILVKVVWWLVLLLQRLLHPGPFESCDEDMLFDASEAEDEREVRRNGIWERRRSGVIKKGKLLKKRIKQRRSRVSPLLLRKKVRVLLRVLLILGNILRKCLQACLRKALKEVLSHCPPSLLQTVSSFGDPGQTSLFGWQLPGCFQTVLRLSPTAAAAISSRFLSAAALKHLLRRQMALFLDDR